MQYKKSQVPTQAIFFLTRGMDFCPTNRELAP